MKRALKARPSACWCSRHRRCTAHAPAQPTANKTAAGARAFLNALHKACPIKINKLLTDNGKEFTDRLFASRECKPSGNHEFDQLCQVLCIEHRLTKPRTPRTNGMVERFNGRTTISESIRQIAEQLLAEE